MTTTTRRARAKGPEASLGRGGRRLYDAVTQTFELDAWESGLLVEACRVQDRLDQLAQAAVGAPLTVTNSRGDVTPHPLLCESRQQALVLARLVASLRLPSGDEAEGRPQRRGAARGSYGIRGSV